MATKQLRFEPVTDSRDPRVAAYVSIRERDLARAHGGRFIVEGKVALETMMGCRFEIESLFLCETKVASLERSFNYLSSTVPIYVAPQGLMDAVVGFPMHRGVLACCKKEDPLSPGQILVSPISTALILVGLSNHDNVGACFRNAAAFGADAVMLDETCCDPLYRKSIRVSSGAALLVPFVHGGTGADLVASARDHFYDVWALTPSEGAQSLPDVPVGKRVALMLGAEGPGLPESLMETVRRVRVPMTPTFDSLNVATAAAIALSHVYNVRVSQGWDPAGD